MEDIQADFDRWHASRLTELSAPEGWLSLVGLYWLETGWNTVGSDAACGVTLPGGPALQGELLVESGRVSWLPAADCPALVEGPADGAEAEGVALRTDLNGAPSVIRLGSLSFFVIEREGRLAVRVKDRDWANRMSFGGLDSFPFDPAWRVEAEWQALREPVELEIPTMAGDLKTVTALHRAAFRLAGVEYSLLPLEEGEEGAFFVFNDATSGRETYGGGRFLRTAPPADGRLLLDFNRAYNPPCAFTPFAACPLPPPENRLPFPVAAGEKRWSGK